MGVVYVDVTIRNPTDPGREWRAPFLVGTGAMDTLVPPECLESIGLRPVGSRTYEIADGRKSVLDVTVGIVEFMGEVTAGRIVVGEAGDKPLLGAIATASAGFELVDMDGPRLEKLPSVRLKRLDGVRVERRPPFGPWGRDSTTGKITRRAP